MIHIENTSMLAVEVTTSSMLSYLKGCYLQLIKATAIPRLQGAMVAMSRSPCLAMQARPHPSINFIFPKAVNSDPPDL